MTPHKWTDCLRYRSILNMAVRHDGLVAFSTQTGEYISFARPPLDLMLTVALQILQNIEHHLLNAGLYVTNVYHDSPTYTVAVNQPNEDAFTGLAWNSGSTGQIYLYASIAASISVYRASQYGA